MLHFEGDSDFTQPPAHVWTKLTTIDFLIQCIPDLESVKHKDMEQFTCIIRPGFSFIRGTLEVTLKLVDLVAQQSLRVQGHGKGIGSSNDVQIGLSFAPQDEGTRIHWVADVTNLGGLLKAMPKGLLQGAARKVIGDVWTSVKAKLDQLS
jgi:carbon monoxide dehydrogenase subunit G